MISKKIARLAAASTLAAGCLSATMVAVTGTASAGTVTPYANHTVCAQDLYVRDAPLGKVIGTLYYGETFDYHYSNGNGWDYGYAYGHANLYGWVEAGHFC